MRKIHKYLGLILFPIIFLLVCSGVVLNHRKQFSRFEVTRSILPNSYRYSNWNYGFFKGGLSLDSNNLLLYGTEGIWISNRDSIIEEFNNGIDRSADQKKIHRIIRTSNNQIFAISSYHLYHLEKDKMRWTKIKLPETEDLFVDIESKADTIVILSRSNYYVGVTNNKQQEIVFTTYNLSHSPKHEIKHSLFKFIWDLHSGALWGMSGKIIVDIIGVLFIFVSFTGFMIWLYKKIIRSESIKRDSANKRKRFLWYHKNHDRWGYWLLIPFILITITGIFLRPPFLLFIANKSVESIPGISMQPKNEWKDMLRAIRYDVNNKSWLIYTSDGMYEFKDLETSEILSKPNTPPISVMGLNVMQQINENEWIIGSFSGLYIWNKTLETYYDALENKNTEIPNNSLPFSNNQISGLIFYNKEQTVLFDYNNGAKTIEPNRSFLKMPKHYQTNPISLWNLSLEIHTGRIVTCLGIFTLLIPCILGIIIMIILISGLKISNLKCFIRHITSLLNNVRKI